MSACSVSTCAIRIDSRIVSAWHQNVGGFERYPRDYIYLTPAAGLYKDGQASGFNARLLLVPQ